MANVPHGVLQSVAGFPALRVLEVESVDAQLHWVYWKRQVGGTKEARKL